MTGLKKKRPIILFLLIILLNLSVHLITQNDFGLSWDFHAHLYEGLFHLNLPYPDKSDPSSPPLDYPNYHNMRESPFGPFSVIPQALSYEFLYRRWHLLPFDAAFNLPTVIIGIAGIGLVFLFLYESVNLASAFFAAVFLSLLPDYFAYLHTNMKDVPSAVAFALVMYSFWRLNKYQRIRDLALALFSVALAFNVKINAFVSLPVCFAWYLVLLIRKKFRRPDIRQLRVLAFFPLAPLAAVAMWWPLWPDPVRILKYMPVFYAKITCNMPNLIFGQVFTSCFNIPWFYPFVFLFIKTPLPILIFFLIGTVHLLYRSLKGDTVRLLFLFWFFLPLARYLFPGVGAIDGIRHFMEATVPLALIAGIGAGLIYSRINRQFLKTGLIILLFAFLGKNIITFHPYQTSFFNSFIGGIKGTRNQFEPDFWGAPQRSAALWLNKNAPLNSTVFMPMAPNSNGVFLRNDLRNRLNSKWLRDSNYVVFLNRSTYMTPEFTGYANNSAGHELIYSFNIEDEPLVWIYKNNP